MSRPYNFAAGPAAIPEIVLERCQKELLNWQDCNGKHSGVSILELGHRTEAFEKLLFQVEAKLRAAINIPENYKLIFLPGGARLQFASIPMNFLGNNRQADYIVTGHWSEVAFSEAQKYGDINLAASSKNDGYFSIPQANNWKISSKAAYRYICSNETLVGVQFNQLPQFDNVPLVADMTSDFLSRSIDVNQYGLIFASTQKNMGTTGLCVVIVREDLLNQQQAITPTVVNFAEQAKQHSLYNTPNVFAVYLLGLMLDWLNEQGGIFAIEKINQNKAEKLYQLIDHSDFYSNRVAKNDRSVMNVSFNLPDEDLSKKFLIEATQHNLINLKGHSVTGGARASLYNPVSELAVDALVKFMKEFEKNN